jgi:hypothetical protein
MVKATGINKTTPDARDKASKETFAKEFLVWVDDATKVPESIIEVNKASVVQEAEQRGLRQDGEVTLVSKEAKSEHNVLLSYTVDVKPADPNQK